MNETPVLSLDDVFVIYPGSVAALRGLSLDLHAGERVVISGPSGSGKSTLVHVVSGHVVPTAGSVRFSREPNSNGAQVGALVRAGHIAVVSQRSATELLPELRVKDNVALTVRLRGGSQRDATRMAIESLERFGCTHLGERFPSSLSAGEAQLVALAGALSGQPSMILADEPTGDLDRASASLVYELLSSYVRDANAALLLVSHDPMANSFADRVATIRDGRLERMHYAVDPFSTGAASRGPGDVQSRDMPLVVDRRGWMRLPDVDRQAAGIRERVHIVSASDSLILRAVSDPTSTVEEADEQESLFATSLGADLLAAESVGVVREGVAILAPVSFVIPANRLTVIVGPSGIGKTTLLSVIGGLRDHDGDVTWFERDRSLAFSALSLGFAEDASVFQNLSFLEVDDLNGEVETILSALGIDHLRDRPVANLSGGERQRVGVARALAHISRVVLLDEPTSQLDEFSAKRMARTLQQERNRGRTIICTTHDERLTEAADHVIRLG